MATQYITFDCYDTLVAYSAGKGAVMRSMVSDKGGDAKIADTVVSRFGEKEKAMLASTAFYPLGTVLRTCLQQTLEEQNLRFDSSDGDRIIQTVKHSQPFDDVAPALLRLKKDYKLAVLSNSEPDIIQHNIAAIGVEFDAVVLAAEVGAYKPDLRMFDALVERCGCDSDEIVHVAQSFYHDIIPGHAKGLRRVWINRNNLTGDAAYGPYEELPNLSALPELLTKPQFR